MTAASLEPRRSIPWESFDASALPSDARSVVGDTWRERMKQEHLAVGAFALLAQELGEDGCDPVVLSLVTRAANDEVRHTEVCRRMAVAFLGDAEVPARLHGFPKVPRHPQSSREERVLLHVVEMCCLSETITGVYFTEMLGRATQPTARAALESLLRDEIDHGRVGWAYLSTRARDARMDGLAAALPALLERTVGRALRQADRSLEDDAAMESYGWLGRATALATVRRALREVIVPGFETLGVDLSVARSTIDKLLDGAP
ncbi:MAG: hypothetical protein ACLP1X_31280 [Polyangiaceae bacterium]